MSDQLINVLPFDDSNVIAEQIQSQRRVVFRQTGILWHSWTDVGKTDYAYWDKARRCRVPGLELSGTLLKPLCEKISAWTVGRPPMWTSNRKRAAEKINIWWREHLPEINRANSESLYLGDSYLVLNGDSTITIVSPDSVEPIVDPDDFQRWLGWRVTTTIENASGKETSQTMTYVDEYTATKRTRTVTKAGAPVMKTEYPNPLGVVPVIHIPNQKSADEMFGRPEGEPLLPLLIRYGGVLDAGLEGNMRQGRPTPVISKLGTAANVDAFWDLYGEIEDHTLPDGTVEQVRIIKFDPDELITLGNEAEFSYEAPGSFSTDTQNLLGILFNLFVQESELPEFILGTAIGSSKASAESQLEPFLKFVEQRRLQAMKWMKELANLLVAYFSVYEATAAGATVEAHWRPMATADGRLTLDTTIWAWSKGFFSDEFATWMLPVNIDDPHSVTEEGRKFREANPFPMVSAGAAGAAGATPASGGGTQDQFNKQTNPIQPTQRQQFMPPGTPPLYEQSVEDILDHNRLNETDDVSLQPGNETNEALIA